MAHSVNVILVATVALELLCFVLFCFCCCIKVFAAKTLQLKMVLIKCCDISNEVRPFEVSEPWVDCLLEEYFNQACSLTYVFE